MMLSVDDALKIVLDTAQVLSPRIVPINDSVGLILDENIIAEENVPPFDNSAMDGFAVLSSDVQNATREKPVILKVIDILQAGKVSDKRLNNSEAIQIMTGAPMPNGADAVVMIEQTERISEESVKCFSAVRKDENRRRAGDDIRAGQKVFQKGRYIKPYDIGVLASIGKSAVHLIPKPRIALLSTGDELAGIEEPLSPGKIRSSNNFTLRALIEQMGAEVLDLGIAKDTIRETEEKLQRAFSADIILTSGGVSMGEFDYVRQALEKLGVEIKFWKVNQKPGKPLVFGAHQNKLFFGLPGNPVSAIVCFQLFVVPAIKKMSGSMTVSPYRLKAQSSEKIQKKQGLRFFLRGTLTRRDNLFSVSSTGNQSSGVMSSLSYGNCLIDIPEEKGNVEAGEEVTVVLLDPLTLNELICS